MNPSIRTLMLMTALAAVPAPGQSPAGTFDALLHSYESYAIPGIASRRFTQADLHRWVQPFIDAGTVTVETVGTSSQGRPLRLYRYGTGPTVVLLWSQMHGDEPTATMAVADLMSFFDRQKDHPVATAIRTRSSVYFLPMINPDGAQVFSRRTAQRIDMNRDAARLATPEARTLKAVRDRLQPSFGFNLHDQDPRYTVGTTRQLTAIALLAPPYDEARSDNEVRRRAKQVAAGIASALQRVIPGRVARWDDTFEPRAFGDNMQRWGTSTVLIESGGWPDDPEKMYLRRLNAAALLDACHAIATGLYATAEVEAYERLPFNMKLGFDVILRNGLLRTLPSGEGIRVDVGLNRTVSVDSATQATRIIWTVEDIGDLSTFTAYTVYDLGGTSIGPSVITVDAELTDDQFKTLIPRN